ncbi:MAG: DNA polymerase III subunit beta [Clostridiales bacterium]|nr:DNA polymerase III subunit beta [Clostridiales bacterium]
MRFKISQKVLMNSISIVIRAVSNKTALPILKGILMEVKENKIILITTDLEIGIKKEVEAVVASEGIFVVEGKLFSEIIRKLPDSSVEIIKTEENKIIIKCENTEFIISTWCANNYPELPQVQEGETCFLENEIFNKMIVQTIFATSQVETKPILKGVLFEIKENILNMVALDGYRLALRKGKIKAENDYKVIVPAKTLNEVNRIINSEEENKTEVNLTENYIIFKTGKSTLISKVLEGEFLNYTQIIPKEFNTRITVNTKKFTESLERASLISTESKKNLVKINITEEKIIVLSNSELGKGYEELEIEKEGDNISIAFNSKYIIEALKVIEEENIVFSFTTNIRPGIIGPQNRDDYIYLVLPVRIAQQ